MAMSLEDGIKRLREIAREECHCRNNGVFKEVCRSCLVARELHFIEHDVNYLLDRVDPGIVSKLLKR